MRRRVSWVLGSAVAVTIACVASCADFRSEDKAPAAPSVAADGGADADEAPSDAAARAEVSVPGTDAAVSPLYETSFENAAECAAFTTSGGAVVTTVQGASRTGQAACRLCASAFGATASLRVPASLAPGRHVRARVFVRADTSDTGIVDPWRFVVTTVPTALETGEADTPFALGQWLPMEVVTRHQNVTDGVVDGVLLELRSPETEQCIDVDDLAVTMVD